MQKINAGLKSLEQELAGYEKQLSEQAEKEISANRIAEVSKLSDTLSRAPATSLPLRRSDISWRPWLMKLLFATTGTKYRLLQSEH